MTKNDILKALDSVDTKYVKSIDVFYQSGSTWRHIMKKSVKLAATAAAVVLTVGVIAIAMFLQSGPGNISPDPGSASEKVKNQKPLRICVDIGTAYDATSDINQQAAIDGLLNYIDDRAKAGGRITSSDIEIEFVPSDSGQMMEREAVLQRLRTENMAGSGPDVFIAMCSSINTPTGDFTKRIFPYVEKSINDNIFLPIDSYIDNSTSTAWENIIPQILDGCKNESGQQVVVPLTFSLPLTAYDGRSAPDYDSGNATWQDVVQGEDRVLAEQIRWLWPEGSAPDAARSGEHPQGISYILPRLADFSSGELSVRKEQLVSMISEGIDSYKKLDKQEELAKNVNVLFCPEETVDLYLDTLSPESNTMVPLRNTEGGATAVICEYCAINGNTKRPDDAFAVIEALIDESFQKGGKLYKINNKMTTNLQLAAPGSTYLGLYFDRELSETYQTMCSQINRVHFPSELDHQLNEMMLEIRKVMQDSYEPEKPDHPVFSDLIIPFIGGSITDHELDEIVTKHYSELERLLGES